jgi:hypothetical protein
MTMNKHKTHEQSEVPASTSSRRARLHALVFSRAAFGTALVAPGGGLDPKIPPFVGE